MLVFNPKTGMFDDVPSNSDKRSNNRKDKANDNGKVNDDKSYGCGCLILFIVFYIILALLNS